MIWLVEHLADTWRWWAAMGAFLGFWPLAQWLFEFPRSPDGREPLPDTTRLVLGLALLLLLLATFLMGALIPWANDGRIEDFTRESLLYKRSIAAGWLLWGLGCWAVAMAFARQRLFMALCSIVWWGAVFVLVGETMGARL